MIVEGDPLTNFSDADRRARQALVMNVYALQKTLAAAHTAARALGAQSADLKKDFAGGGAKADSVVARVGRVQADVDRSIAATGGSVRPIEAWSGMPTLDQRRQIDYAMEDANKAVAELNSTIGEVSAMYASTAKKAWPKPVQPVVAKK
jgi:phage shock protein A